MRPSRLFSSLKLTFFVSCFTITICSAQPRECVFKDTLFAIDFGSETSVQSFNLKSLKKYRQAYGPCPDDGFYSYASSTTGCFNGDWLTINSDHTPGDISGNMFLVNANERAGEFFTATLSGFKPGGDYEFAVWMMNVCRINGGCSPLPPEIDINLETQDGKKLAVFHTGRLLQGDAPIWKRYYGLFTMPTDVSAVIVKMRNNTNGGCGNDFAMDDIIVRECYPPAPPIVKESKPTTVIEKPKIPPAIVIEKKLPEPEARSLKKNTRPAARPESNTTAVAPKSVTVESPRKAALQIPLPLLSRKNALVQQIETNEGEILIELYDNGEIDGDTVSIYHNNQLIVSRKGLSEKPISFKITIDPSQNYHEIIMVADNLGSIPPNTSLMIATTNGKRYEIFISSSEQQNAKVIISKK